MNYNGGKLMENEKVLERTAFDYSKTADMIQTILIALIALLVPTFLAKLLSLASLWNLVNLFIAFLTAIRLAFSPFPSPIVIIRDS